jgi:2-polyprenyl-6-methoxyphenol hydroxylase-like FAD-dependent oxidoreductase
MTSALVIGGGPAGSVAALLLARGGWRVTLVEQHRFPRDKVCGECLSHLGAAVLRRLDLFEDVFALGAVRLDRTLLHAPSGVSVDVKLPRPMWGVSRTALDGFLLNAAARAGADVLQPARCESLESGPRPAVRVRDLLTNMVSRLDADVVLVADGKAALFNDGPPPPTGELGIKTHFENVDGPRDAIELFGLNGCYGGLAPIEGGRWNAALSVPAARVRRHSGNLACLFAELIEENVALRGRLASACQIGPWLAAPLPRFAVRRDWPLGVIPIGNAAAAIEPIGGEGMGLAMRSAEIAAAALLAEHSRDSRPYPPLDAPYRRLWRARRLACRGAARFASSPRCANLVAPLLRISPAALRPVLSLLHK